MNYRYYIGGEGNIFDNQIEPALAAYEINKLEKQHLQGIVRQDISSKSLSTELTTGTAISKRLIKAFETEEKKPVQVALLALLKIVAGKEISTLEDFQKADSEKLLDDLAKGVFNVGKTTHRRSASSEFVMPPKVNPSPMTSPKKLSTPPSRTASSQLNSSISFSNTVQEYTTKTDEYGNETLKNAIAKLSVSESIAKKNFHDNSRYTQFVEQSKNPDLKRNPLQRTFIL